MKLLACGIHPQLTWFFFDSVKTVCLQPYPVTRVHGEIFRKEVDRLILL